MNQEKQESEERSFGEKLLGMQGFSAVRAERYRVELERLLVHRINPVERWIVGISGIFICVILTGGGVLMAMVKPRSLWADYNEARLIFAGTGIATGLILGGWLLRIAVQGGYGRRLGDIVGPFIALIFCGGWGYALMSMAWDTADATMRMKLLLVAVTLFVVVVIIVVLAQFQRLHRQTQEKLLRIEYHVAQLMERSEMRSLS